MTKVKISGVYLHKRMITALNRFTEEIKDAEVNDDFHPQENPQAELCEAILGLMGQTNISIGDLEEYEQKEEDIAHENFAKENLT